MSKVTRSCLENLKARISIEDVVAPVVVLKPAGNQMVGLSPFSQEKTPSFYITPDKGFFKCFSSGKSGDIFEFVMETKGMDFQETLEYLSAQFGIPLEYEGGPKNPIAALRVSLTQRLRNEAIKSKSSKYLASRGLEVAPGLEWAKKVPYYVEGNVVAHYDAMLAPVFRGDKFITYHVTYLQNGKKAPQTPCRKILRGSMLKGGSCPLYPHGEHLGIAEGIETAIAAKMLFGIPVWSALNTSLLSEWLPPKDVKKVTIFSDHDSNFAGQSAAYKLGHRLKGRGLEVEMRIPEVPDTDWNDVLLERMKNSEIPY